MSSWPERRFPAATSAGSDGISCRVRAVLVRCVFFAGSPADVHESSTRDKCAITTAWSPSQLPLLPNLIDAPDSPVPGQTALGAHILPRRCPRDVPRRPLCALSRPLGHDAVRHAAPPARPPLLDRPHRLRQCRVQRRTSGCLSAVSSRSR